MIWLWSTSSLAGTFMPIDGAFWLIWFGKCTVFCRGTLLLTVSRLFLLCLCLWCLGFLAVISPSSVSLKTMHAGEMSIRRVGACLLLLLLLLLRKLLLFELFAEDCGRWWISDLDFDPPLWPDLFDIECEDVVGLSAYVACKNDCAWCLVLETWEEWFDGEPDIICVMLKSDAFFVGDTYSTNRLSGCRLKVAAPPPLLLLLFDMVFWFTDVPGINDDVVDSIGLLP